MLFRRHYACTHQAYNIIGITFSLSSSGDLTILEGVTITIESNGTSPQFTLACVSTGGPATSVTWTGDFDIVNEGTETVLDDPVTAQYTHTLTVTEMNALNSTYKCVVSNNKPSSASVAVETTVIFTGYGNYLNTLNRMMTSLRFSPHNSS